MSDEPTEEQLEAWRVLAKLSTDRGFCRYPDCHVGQTGYRCARCGFAQCMQWVSPGAKPAALHPCAICGSRETPLAVWKRDHST